MQSASAHAVNLTPITQTRYNIDTAPRRRARAQNSCTEHQCNDLRFNVRGSEGCGDVAAEALHKEGFAAQCCRVLISKLLSADVGRHGSQRDAWAVEPHQAFKSPLTELLPVLAFG